MSFLSVENLSANYEEFNLNISFSMEKNEFVSIIGPSGCGKSTTLQLLAGLIAPSSGKIVLNGMDITKAKPQERHIGMVFQDYALFPHMNVIKNIEYALRLQGLTKAQIKTEGKKYLEFIHLKGYEKRKIDTLSGGEKQRIALARSLAASPNLLLLDEPLSALDAALRRQLRSEIREIQQSTNTPFIYVTHDREEAFSLSDKIIVMDNGKVVMSGKPEEIYQKPNNLFTAFFSGDGTAIEAEKLISEFKGKTLFFRPESIKLYTPTMIIDSKDNIILENAKILGYDYTGSDYLLGVEHNGNRMLVKTDKKPTISTISLYINKNNLIIF